MDVLCEGRPGKAGNQQPELEMMKQKGRQGMVRVIQVMTKLNTVHPTGRLQKAVRSYSHGIRLRKQQVGN